MKIREHFNARIEEGFVLDRRRKIASIVFFALSCLYVLVMLIGGFNQLVTLGPVVAMVYGIIMFCTTLKSGRINIFNLLSYSVLMLGTYLTYLIRGADEFWWRAGYNLMLCALGIIGVTLVILTAKLIKNKKSTYIVATLATFLMVMSSLFYTLFASIRIRPIGDKLYGQDDYLEAVRNSGTVDPNSPNVLIILMDDMAYADISAYSYLGSENATINTPNIDAIAEEGIMMENAYASSPVSSPSRFGILTGRYSARGHLDNVVFQTKQQNVPFSTTRFFNPFQLPCNTDGILGDEITIAEVMQAKGYATGLFGKWNLGDYGEYLPTNQGFDYFFGSHYINDMNPYNIVREVDGNVEEIYDNDYRKEQSESTKIFSEELDGYLEKTIDNGEKFFVEYWSPWPHFPIFSGEKGNKADDNYIDCIQEFDHYLGKTFDMLKEKGVYDDTLIIFTSDNGPGREGVTGNHRGRKNTTFDGGHKVPLVASWKNGTIGKGDNIRVGADGIKKIDTSSMNIDLFPTLLDYCNIKDSNGNILLPQDRVIDGANIRGLWDGTQREEERVHDAIFYLKRGKVEGIQMPLEADIVFKAGDGVERNEHGIYDFKYYDKVHTENSAFIDQFYVNYLFNLDIDPAEGYNVAMTQPTVVDKMNERLLEFRREMKTNRRGKLDK